MNFKRIIKKWLISRFVIEASIITILAAVIFWFAQENDLFEYLVSMSREHEDLELDEFFTLLMISSIALLFIILRNIKYLKGEIKQRIAAEKEIKKLAFYDTLTGLPNRELCNDRLNHLINHAERNKIQAAVLFIDLDNFKKVNDTLGHDAGDELLKQSATRLSSQLRKGDTVSRFAGDEFIILIESVSSVASIIVLAEKLVDSLSLPFTLNGQEAYIGISLGIALYPDDGKSGEALIKNADTAMYHAKHDGKNTFRFYSESLDAQSQYKLKVSAYLRQAIINNELTLNYQPIIDLKTKKTKGAEALLRWHNEELGHISPDVFIPIAEEIGIISDIGNWVLQEACRQNKQWQQLGYKPIIMAVNMSAHQLNFSGYVDTVLSTLEQTGLSAKYLELELTESAIMKDVNLAIVRLEQLKKLGISIALDDFGTGYSSMSYLRKLKLTRLKIDKSFIKNIPDSYEDTITTKAIITLANNLSFKVTVEGIENQSQLYVIEKTVADSAQGYYFSKPLSAQYFEKLLY